VKARSFRNEGPRIQMFELADDYEHKAKIAEELETRIKAMQEG